MRVVATRYSGAAMSIPPMRTLPPPCSLPLVFANAITPRGASLFRRHRPRQTMRTRRHATRNAAARTLRAADAIPRVTPSAIVHHQRAFDDYCAAPRVRRQRK